MDETLIRWYAVHSRPCQEGLADTNLRAQGYLTFYPFERVRRRRRITGTTRFAIQWVEVAHFPRYLFVALRKDGESLYAVNETLGVATVVYAGGEPLEVPHDVMDELTARLGLDGDAGTVKYAPGQEVRFVEESPLAGLVAAVAVDKGKAVRLWIDVLGQKRGLTVDPEWIVAS